MNFTKAAKTKEILHHLLVIGPAVKLTLCAHSEGNGPMARLVLSSSQWPSKHGECDSSCVRVFTPSEPNRCMYLQLSGDFSVLRLSQTVHQVSGAGCVSCLHAASFQTGQKHVGQSRMIPTSARWGHWEHRRSPSSSSCALTAPLLPATHGHSAHQHSLHCADFTPLG